MSAPPADPGWAPVVRLLPKMLIPFIGMRTMSTQASALMSLRMMWLYIAIALMPLWPVTALVVAELDPAWSAGATSAAVAAFGATTLAGSRFVDARVSLDSVAAFTATFPRLSMLRYAMAAACGLVGFAGAVVAASVYPFAVGFGFVWLGLVVAAPTKARLAAVQAGVDAQPTRFDVVAALVDNRLGR